MFCGSNQMQYSRIFNSVILKIVRRKLVATAPDGKKERVIMRAIVTVTGKDHVGIIGAVCTKLSHFNVNILDISQTVLQGFFTMTMVVDVSEANEEFGTLIQQMADYGARSRP